MSQAPLCNSAKSLFNFSKSLAIGVCAITLVFISGCASPVRQLRQAQELQKRGDCNAALAKYASVLARIPEQNRRAISLVQQRIGECFWSLNKPKDAYLAFQKAVEEDAENTVAHLRLSEVLLAGSAPAEALDEAGLVLRREPGNVDALSVRGAALSSMGQMPQAQAAFTRVLALDPGRVEAAMALAEIYLQLGAKQSARAVLEKISLAKPEKPTPLLALARMEELEGNASAAEQDYRRAVVNQNSEQTMHRLAQFLSRSARIKEAEEVLRALDATTPALPAGLPDFDLASGRTPSAMKLYAEDLQATPATASRRAAFDARIIEADLQFAQEQQPGENNDFDGSLTNAKHHLQQFSSQLDPVTKETLQAEIALAQGDLLTSQQHAASAIAQSANSPSAHYILGIIKQRKGDAGGAMQEWVSSLQKDSEFLPARQALAEQALRAGDLAAAEEYIAEVVRQEPANFQALCIYGRLLVRQKRFAEAKGIAQRSLAANSSAAAPHVLLGDMALEQRRLATALIQYEQALVLAPHSTAAITGLTRVYRHGQITRPMLAKMEAIAASPPPSAPLMEIAGRLYAERGWYKDGERCLRGALQIDRQRVTAVTALARTYMRVGDPQSAAKSLSQFGVGSARLLSGLLASEHNDLRAAMRNYELALRGSDRSGLAANNLAWLYAQQGAKLDRALALALAAHDSAPRNPAVLDTLGFVHLKRHEYSQAVQTLKEAVELATLPDGSAADPEIIAQFRLHLMEAYLRSGQTQAAQAVAK